MTMTSIPVFYTPCIYAGDFNCHHIDWGYNNINSDGERLAAWAPNNVLTLLQDPMDTFHPGRWKSETNADLAIVKIKATCQLPDRRVLGKFSWSQHRPSLITTFHRHIISTSKLLKRWNFRKTDWKRCGNITNNFDEKLPQPDAYNEDIAYQAFCCTTINATSLVRQEEIYRPCWDKEYEALFFELFKSPLKLHQTLLPVL